MFVKNWLGLWGALPGPPCPLDPPMYNTSTSVSPEFCVRLRGNVLILGMWTLDVKVINTKHSLALNEGRFRSKASSISSAELNVNVMWMCTWIAVSINPFVERARGAAQIIVIDSLWMFYMALVCSSCSWRQRLMRVIAVACSNKLLYI